MSSASSWAAFPCRARSGLTLDATGTIGRDGTRLPGRGGGWSSDRRSAIIAPQCSTWNISRRDSGLLATARFSVEHARSTATRDPLDGERAERRRDGSASSVHGPAEVQLTTSDPARRQDRSRRRARDVGRAEPAGDDGVDRSVEQSGERGVASVASTSTRSVEPEPAHEAAQVIGAGRPAIDQHDVQVRSRPGDHQSGHAAAAAEVDDRAGHVLERRRRTPRCGR